MMWLCIKYIIILFLIEDLKACKEYECGTCQTCGGKGRSQSFAPHEYYNFECVDYDIGEDCVPKNGVALLEDLRLYYKFYYSKAATIEEFRCGHVVSYRYILGMNVINDLTRDEFESQYKDLTSRECVNSKGERWASVTV